MDESDIEKEGKMDVIGGQQWVFEELDQLLGRWIPAVDSSSHKKRSLRLAPGPRPTQAAASTTNSLGMFCIQHSFV